MAVENYFPLRSLNNYFKLLIAVVCWSYSGKWVISVTAKRKMCRILPIFSVAISLMRIQFVSDHFVVERLS